jgi:hypothetical protein
VTHPHITRAAFESLVVFAARAHYDERSAPCVAWFRGEQPCVTIAIGGDSITCAWTGRDFVELPHVHRCAECGDVPGAGAYWSEDDDGVYCAGCAACARVLEQRAKEARVDRAVDAMEMRAEVTR